MTLRGVNSDVKRSISDVKSIGDIKGWISDVKSISDVKGWISDVKRRVPDVKMCAFGLPVSATTRNKY